MFEVSGAKHGSTTVDHTRKAANCIADNGSPRLNRAVLRHAL